MIFKLKNKPFDQIKSGMPPKRVEIRLLDRKRHLKVGSTILMVSERGEELTVIVKKLYVFNNFLELFNSISTDRCGFEGLSPEQAAEAMSEYYPIERSAKYKVLAIEFEIADYV